MKHLLKFTCLLVAIVFYNCKGDDDDNTTETDPILTENVVVHNPDLFEDGYILAVENGGVTSYLLDKSGQKVAEWEFEDNLGNDLELLDDGRLIGMFKSPDPDVNFGGFGGIIKILNSDGLVEWEHVYASESTIAHHDVEMLPNGNVLFIAWERIGNFEAVAAGVSTVSDIFIEVLVEINPSTNDIVWKWNSFDHIIQDQNSSQNNFGVVNDNPQLIDINYNLVENGDIMHANGIDYDEVNDIIYLSVNGYSEVWVIDHSTTIEEAASNTGGNYGKGGDLIYRFGNPEAYQNNAGQRLFYNNHFPNLLEGDEPGAGNLLIYGNGNDIEQSTVYELDLPEVFELSPNTNNEPTIVWSFTDENLFFGRISGASRLLNGNTIIAEGDFGIWEVTPQGEVAWKYDGLGPKFWRCYGYTKNSEAIINIGL